MSSIAEIVLYNVSRNLRPGMYCSEEDWKRHKGCLKSVKDLSVVTSDGTFINFLYILSCPTLFSLKLKNHFPASPALTIWDFEGKSLQNMGNKLNIRLKKPLKHILKNCYIFVTFPGKAFSFCFVVFIKHVLCYTN